MIKTFGLTHISLSVSDIERSYCFYHNIFGIQEYWRDDNTIHASTPSSHDVITFIKGEKINKDGIKNDGINHFGFRLVNPLDITNAVIEVEKAGGKIIEKGEFAPGVPFAYASDPDGYIFEIWYE
ncbi:MAG: VOC family protein [Ignavibacteria bacterium]|nr:VOC family protein [Ignavibacteria bacterium]